MSNSYLEQHGITEDEHDAVQAEFYADHADRTIFLSAPARKQKTDWQEVGLAVFGGLFIAFWLCVLAYSFLLVLSK